jgi:hypothetical protein
MVLKVSPDGVYLTAKKYTDLVVRHERRLRKAHQRSETEKFKVFLRRNDEHLARLNGEGARIQAVLSHSVTAEKFGDYQDSQRLAVAAADRASRDAFAIYSGKVELQIAAITKLMNRWAGGLAVLIFALGIWLKYGR